VGQKSDTSRTLYYIVREVSLFWPTLYTPHTFKYDNNNNNNNKVSYRLVANISHACQRQYSNVPRQYEKFHMKRLLWRYSIIIQQEWHHLARFRHITTFQRACLPVTLRSPSTSIRHSIS